MSKASTVLTDRQGTDFPEPSAEALAAAIADLHWHQDDEPNSSIVLRRGVAGGEMRVLELFADQSMTYSHYADCDFETLLSGHHASSLGVADVARRLRYLYEGDAEALDRCKWKKPKAGMPTIAWRRV